MSKVNQQSNTNITKEEYNNLVQMTQSMKPQEHASKANMDGKILYAPQENLININNPRNSWIIDSGASEYITTIKIG